MTTLWIGLGLAMVSAVAVNWAYSREHDAVASMPPFTWRRPVSFVSSLLRSRPWVTAFGMETVGWLLYVGALRLAPLALVQAVCASGIAVLALATARGHPGRLTRREQLAVVVAVLGLVLLALSLGGLTPSDHAPAWAAVAVWLGALGAGALALVGAPVRLARGPALGLAAGLLFAGGDICAKLIVYGGAWFAALVPLIAFYALGTSVLQGAFRHANALTAAGLATLATNAVPIAAGFVVFGEELPDGVHGGLQVAAFASLVVSATLLGHSTRSRSAQTGTATGSGASSK